MLWGGPATGFLFTVDNFGATYTTAGFGTAVTSGLANVLGADVELISDTLVTSDIYAVAIIIGAANASAAARTFLWNIKADRAGGTAYTTFIPNLLANSPAITTGGTQYFFPVYLPAGTAIAANVQCSAASIAGRIGVRLYGKPIHPELLKTGAFVRDFGANTATSAGTAITPGTSAMGAYTASLGTTVDDLWYWQAGMASGDTTRTDTTNFFDVAAGDATNKVLCLEHGVMISRANESDGMVSGGLRYPMQPIKSGSDVFMRSACSTAPDATMTCVAYGVGG